MSARWRTASAPRPKAGMHPGRWRRESVQPVVPRTLAQSTDDVVPLQACAPERAVENRPTAPRRAAPEVAPAPLSPVGEASRISGAHRL